MKKVCVCGHFGGNKDFFDGQTVKTKNVYNALINSGIDVYKIDTYNPKKRLPVILIKCFLTSFFSKDIIILPAHNGVKIFAPLFNILSKIFKNRVHYVIVGGWLCEYIKDYPWLKKHLSQLHCLYAETSQLKRELDEAGLTNNVIMPNFKDIKSIKEDEILEITEPPLKLLTFSRVMEMKGISEGIETVVKINKEAGKKLFELDIYGPVEEDYKEVFDKLVKENEDCIKYMGIKDASESVSILRNYFLLIFPTKFATEGHPGTILDAYNAGVPVVASRWNSWSDLIDENTGFTFEFGNFKEMEEILIEISKNPDIINKKRKYCLKKAEEFKCENIIKIIKDKIGE